MTGESLNRSLWMIPFVRFHGSNNGQLVHVFRNSRENLRNLDSRGIRSNGPETAIPFHIPAIEMADSTFEPNQNNRLRFGLRSCRSRRAQCKSLRATERQKVAQADPHKTQGTHSQKISAGVRNAPAMFTIHTVHNL